MTTKANTTQPRASVRDMARERLDRQRTIEDTQTSKEAATEALESLLALPDDAPSKKRQEWLKRLGSEKTSYNKKRQANITGMHGELAEKYQVNELAPRWTQEEVKQDLLKLDRLDDLFARGQEGFTILHVILDPCTYELDTGQDRFATFECHRVTPLIKLLLKVHPELPAIGSGSGPPILQALEARHKDSPSEKGQFRPAQKKAILDLLCDNSGEMGGAATAAALKSLCQKDSLTHNALHIAIKTSDFDISDKVWEQLCKVKLESQTGLEICNSEDQSCLHLAVTPPIDARKARWAVKIAELQPNLLRKKAKPGDLTPLQYLEAEADVKPEGPNLKLGLDLPKLGDVFHRKTVMATDPEIARLKKVRAELKRCCLVNFDHNLCTDIMYKKDDEREIFLTLEDTTVSWKLLSSQKQHYELDTLLKLVHIGKGVSVHWDSESSAARTRVNTWKCAGNSDFFIVFEWLRNVIKVEKIVEIVVDDGALSGHSTDDMTVQRKTPHSDKAIIECLKGLDVEIFDWQRNDISTDVILSAAPNVKTLYLYCSGLEAVLQGWADTNGLVRLRKLSTVILRIHQGLESIEGVRKYAHDFKKKLEKSPALSINFSIIPAPQPSLRVESAASKMKGEDEQGFEEQDWLKCMDEFADLMHHVQDPLNPDLRFPTVKRRIKVALIDDGVTGSYAGLDDNIAKGKAWGWQPREAKAAQTKSATTQREYLRNYNSSHTGHGTVMAYYIKRVCPNVLLYVAKLAPKPQQGDYSGRGQKITFTCDSAAKAIKWAVDMEVDIISMSWAVDEKDSGTSSKTRTDAHTALTSAVREACDKKILLFCANPDKGPGHTGNMTMPGMISAGDIFCVGAAAQNGRPWDGIDASDESCNYFLPGVDLGLRIESSSSSRNLEAPPKEWKKYSGSSLSCALAAGLAAMVLHCVLITGAAKLNDDCWKWLSSQQGMSEVFGNIQGKKKTRWLPVRDFFKGALQESQRGEEERKRAVERLVAALVRGAPTPLTRVSSQPLKRQPTLNNHT